MFPTFFPFNHRKPQKLLLRDLCQRVQITEKLMSYITRHESFSVSGEKNRREGADFVHENSNRTTKPFLHQECQQLKRGGESVGKLQI